MKYNLTYKQAIDKLNNGLAVRPQSFMYSFQFLMMHEDKIQKFEMDNFNKQNLYLHGEYTPTGTDKLSKWAVFDALSC